MDAKTKLAIARDIEKWGKKYGLLTDTRIYFSNKAWDYDSSGKKKIIKNIKASDYFDYANKDKTVSASFEGEIYTVMNGYGDNPKRDGMIVEELIQILDKKYDVYFEKGNAWNFAIIEG